MEPLRIHGSESDPNEVRRAIAVLFEDEYVVELRVLDARKNGRKFGTVSGYFDGKNREAMAAAADEWSGNAVGVYFTLNPVDPACLGRAANRVKDWAKHATKEDEILCRRLLLIDVDAGQPSGVSATDAEHEAAIDLARRIGAWLSSLGWPKPFFVDSGNGAHLYYRIALPNDAKSTALVKAVLIAVDQYRISLDL